jgi:hypothetical protein
MRLKEFIEWLREMLRSPGAQPQPVPVPVRVKR